MDKNYPEGHPLYNRTNIDEEMEEFYARMNPPQERLFTLKPMNQCLADAAATPDSRQLFGELWFENEICILYGDTGTGKSILAYQLANHISAGVACPLAGIDVVPQKVLYIDCELSEKQVQMRYSADGDNYLFHPDLFRSDIAPGASPPMGVDYDDHVVATIEELLIETNARVLIVDNISYLKNETEKAKDALSLMKHLKALKTKYQLSIMVLAHTPKRDMSKPICKNDLAGSKALINFCDSAFAIGKSSQGPNMRYLKQIKERNVEQVYGPENVIVCSIIRQPANYLHLAMNGHSTEQEHLKEWTEKDREDRIEEIKALNKKGMTQREIAAQLSVSLSMVNRYLKK